MQIERVYHHYAKMEEYEAGMWSNESGEAYQRHAEAAAQLMRQPEAFEAAMMRALDEWPNSCEHNLSAMGSINRQAWTGHAGCCIATGSPEEPTRIGWHLLNSEEQDKANEAADKVIAEWERRHVEKQQAKQETMQPSLFTEPLTPGGEEYDVET